MSDPQFRWWQTGIVYQIYPRSFQDSNGDGVGDLPGIVSRLDYLVDLGVDAIWISPFYKSPMADFGYDVADYCDVDPIFGTLADFDHLLEEAHARGIKVIIDWVPNHTSSEHPWFLESRSSRDNPKRDWYIWRDAKPDGSRPNNWGSIFGGPAWEWDETTQQYYYHYFVKGQPDLNWANPEVVKAMTDVLRFWLQRGVDGFRMDVVYLLAKYPGMPDNPINPDATPLNENDIFGVQHHVYDSIQPEVHRYTRMFRQITDQYGDTVIVGEVWEDDLNEWIKFYGPEGDEIQLPFNFRLMQLKEWNAGVVSASVNEFEDALPEFAWPNYVIGNHDRTRPATRVGSQAQARIAQMLLLTVRGTPTMYQGDELGMEEAQIPREQWVDPWGINLGITRDGCRTPMQWDGSRYAGFSTVEPWLPVQADHTWRNVEAMSDDPHSFLSLVKRLIALRRVEPALHLGVYRRAGAPDGVFAYIREHDGRRFLIALNFTFEEKRVPLNGPGVVAISTHLDRADETAADTLTLRPDEGVVVLLG